jgi:four helix bundle protein
MVAPAMRRRRATRLMHAYWLMPPRRTLRVIDAAEDFAIDVHRCFSGRRRRKSYAEQASRAAASVYANLVEGFGRGPGPDRMRLYRYARSSCEEALGWIRLSHRIDELASRNFYRLTNRGVAIIWMIRGLRY